MQKIKTLALLLLISTSIFSQEKRTSYNLMPWPKEIKQLSDKFYINDDFTISLNIKNSRVQTYATNFLRRLANRTGVFINNGFPFINKENTSLSISFQEVVKLQLENDESYNLTVTNNEVLISSKTDIGSIRALETLLQLVNYDSDGFYFEGAIIKDLPRFKWRGLMIDAARHFQPIEVIKRNLRAMASVKMNVFHWHLSDDQGYRVESKIYPKLQELASDGLYYTQNQIKDVVNYANTLGIRVVPEIDVPGHATAILTAYPEFGSKKNYAYKIERYAGIFDPTLDPTNPKTYTFLDNLFKEITMLFPDKYFHIGGDENEGKHWDSNKKIQLFKKRNNLNTNHDLQTYFNIKLEKILAKYNKKLMGWDEILTPNMPKTAIIHSWRGKNEGFEKGTLIEAVKKGYTSVLSNDYYIDRLQSVNHYYLCDPIANNKLTKEEESRVLGGEVTMWSELVTPLTIDSRIWPKTAAIAERFWSPQNVRDLNSMSKRLKIVSVQLEEIGITHIKNKSAILRNITRGQQTNSINTLTKIYEPLKIYNRNKGGTEYKSFSPFTLFADACSSDAEDAITFTKIVSIYSKNNTKENKKQVMFFLKKWSNGFTNFSQLRTNPNIKKLQPFYLKLNKVSKTLLNSLNQNSKLSKKQHNTIKKQLTFLAKPMEDTELMIIDSLHKLVTTLK